VTNNAPALFPLGTTPVTWTVKDASGNSATATQTVTITESVQADTIHVSNLNGSVDSDDGKFWYAQVSITVQDSANINKDNVTVSGSWSDGSIGSCITDVNGQCSILSRKSRNDSLAFTVTDLSNSVDNYDPNANSDSDGDSDGTVIMINRDGTIPGGNTPPIAANDTATTALDVPVTIQVLDNDSDADGDNLTITSVTNPSNGAASHNDTTVTYTPNTGFTGEDSFTYTISDGNGGEATAIVTVTDPDALTAPTDLSAKLSRRTETVALKWNDLNSGEDGFIIERSSDGNNWTEITGPNTNVTVTVTEHDDSLSNQVGTFYYQVKAYNEAGESNYSNIDSIIKK
jgi:hypothetical protein